MKKYNVLFIVFALLVGIFIGRNIPETDNIISAENNTEYYNSQTQFYDNMVQDVDKMEMYETSELTEETLTNRYGKIVVEKVVGKVTNYKLDGKILNKNPEYGDYISYKRVDGAKEGDVVLTYFIYNPFTNEIDDVLTRLDFIIDDNTI